MTERQPVVEVPESLLAQYPADSGCLSLALLRREGSVPVELTSHTDRGSAPASLTLAWPRRAGLTTVGTTTPSPQACRGFWETLAVGALSESAGELTVPLATRTRKESVVLVVRVGESRAGRIDAVGGSALAFLSSGIDADLDRLVDAGAESRTPVAVIDLDHSRVEIGFAIAPGGVPIELLRPAV